MILFEWDQKKANENFKNHGVSFDEASTVFSDVLSLTIHDPEHSDSEDRYIIIGISVQNRLVVVVHTEIDVRIRIISARLATRKEKNQYEEGQY